MQNYNHYRKQGYSPKEDTVPTDSGLLGKTIAELEKEYEIIFDHIHPGKIDLKTKVEPKPDYKLISGDGFHIWGRLGNMTRFLKDLSSRVE